MTPPPDLAAVVVRATGSTARKVRALAGGCIDQVLKVDLTNGAAVVVKQGERAVLEGWMLDYLRGHGDLPVPEVLLAEDGWLVMSFIDTAGPLDDDAERHAADLLVRLHETRGPAFGFERDTVIASLAQPNPRTPLWRDFFRDHRLLHMAGEADDAGRLPADMRHRIDRLAGRLDRWIEEPDHPALIHGDMWGGNVLTRAGRIAGFIDPAIYHADPEIELAFSTLFSTFGAAFFDRYGERRPLRPGFFEARRDLYNLYPLLVHVRLFGAGYVGSVDGILKRFGC